MRLVFDAIDLDVVDGRRTDWPARAHRNYCRRLGEPIRWGIERAEVGRFLEECGWRLVDLTGAKEAWRARKDPATKLRGAMPFMFFVTAEGDTL